jgi:hypothetical protein
MSERSKESQRQIDLFMTGCVWLFLLAGGVTIVLLGLLAASWILR